MSLEVSVAHIIAMTCEATNQVLESCGRRTGPVEEGVAHRKGPILEKIFERTFRSFALDGGGPPAAPMDAPMGV